MKNLIFEKDDIKKNFAIALAVLACLFRLFLSYTQYATIYPPLAPLDDDLTVSYTHLTLPTICSV